MAGKRIRGWTALVAITAIVGAITALGTNPSSAYIASTGGALIKISPPASVNFYKNGICSPTKVFTFDEQQGVTLGAPVNVQYTTPGTYTTAVTTQTPSIPAGTVVDSHFLDSNQHGCPGTTVRDGTWTFSHDILGVIVGRGRLANSDFLGAPGTDYGGSYPSREFDFGGGSSSDSLQIVNSRTVSVHLQTEVGSNDQMRVITKHNSAPVPNADGPYAGVEGSPVALSATAPDVDGDPVTKSWSFTWTAKPGTSCTPTGTTTLTPTITCNDDALVTATLSASDAYHPPVTSVANVTIANLAPVIASTTVPTTPVALGAPVALSGTFTDAGAHDTHTASINWGDSTMSTASINESLHSISGSHNYSMPGLYSITVNLNDDDGGTTSATTTDVSVVGPPTASAGGPYNSDEGSTTGLVGAASGSLPLTQSWSFTPGASDPGTLCTYTGITSLAPTVSCNDDVVVAAQLSVSDGVNAPVLSSSSVAVTNVAPVLGAVTATAGPVNVGQPVNVSGGFTDAGTNDTHTSSVDWGDMATSAATVTEAGGSGSVSGTHSYSAPGLYTITVDVNDHDGGITTRTTMVLVDTPPVADAGGPYVGNEGSTLTLGGSASDVDSEPLTVSWSFVVAGGPGTVCATANTNTLTPTINCNDDATVTATLRVTDGITAPVSSTATVIVGNVAPTAGAVATSAPVLAKGAPFTASLGFNDAGTNDTHTGVIDWGDSTNSPASISELGGSGTASGSHNYTSAGIYTVTVTVTDDNSELVIVTAAGYTVVYDPGAGSITGGGFFNSPSGAYTPENSSDTNFTGLAAIGFEAKYHTGDTVPTGLAIFRFQAADLAFDSTGYSWLVVTNSATKAVFRGTGTVNSAPGYEFLVSAIDGIPDRVRIKVWNASTNAVVYDNQAGAPDSADPTTPMLLGPINIQP